MGSEQSSQQNQNSQQKRAHSSQLRRGKSVPSKVEDNEEEERTGSISPGPSVCSDSDLPYISYTVNRPIGDSPKLTSKQPGALQRGKSLGSANDSPTRSKFATTRKSSTPTKNKAHNIVVVKPAKEPDSEDKDPFLIKLQQIPMFLPIMRGTLNLPGMRDPEILERLNPQDLLGLCKRLQSHMALSSEHVAANQNQITSRIRDVDIELCNLVSIGKERQKKLTKQSEKLSRVKELSHQLNNCHIQLNKTLQLIENLNNALPLDYRLEPFVWTTG